MWHSISLSFHCFFILFRYIESDIYTNTRCCCNKAIITNLKKKRNEFEKSYIDFRFCLGFFTHTKRKSITVNYSHSHTVSKWVINVMTKCQCSRQAQDKNLPSISLPGIFETKNTKKSNKEPCWIAKQGWANKIG